MLEKSVEQYLCREVRKRGGQAFKWSSPGIRGVPDRLVVLPSANIFGVEVKAPGKKPTVLQHRVHEQLRSLGLEVAVVDSFESIDQLLGDL